MNRYSVILRAYNAGEQIETSIKSVLDQAYPHWELVIVNDGSTDNTRQVAEEFAAKDCRIHVVNQSNRGCVLATQAGFRASTGDCVVLLDAGDRFEPDCLLKVNQAFEEHPVDMVVMNYNIFGVDGTLSRFQYFEQDRTLSMPEALELILKTTNSCLWNKVIRREKLQYTDAQKQFFEEAGKALNFGDDLYLLMSPLLKCSSIHFLPDCLHDYVMDAGSITHQKIKEPWQELCQRVQLMEVTYETIRRAGYLTDSIQSILQINCAMFISTCIDQIFKERMFSGEQRKRLRSNGFYRNLVAHVPLAELGKRISNRAALKFLLFNKLFLLI